MKAEFTTMSYVTDLLAGVCAAALFIFIVGDLTAADYLIEQLTLVVIEVPFVLGAAVVEHRHGRIGGFVYTAAGILTAVLLSDMSVSIGPVMYVKVALTGCIIGDTLLYMTSFPRRLTVIAAPGLLFALVMGLPMVMNGVPAEVVESIRQDALEMYKTFMTTDEAMNTADNAIEMFRGVFEAGVAVFAIMSYVLSWLSLVAARWALPKFGAMPGVVPPFEAFKLPFHLIWLFLLGFGLVLLEWEMVYPFALNILVATVFFYMVQGIAIVMYHMNRARLGMVPRVIFWLLFFITFGFLLVFLVFAGIIDNWFSLRPARKGAEDEGGNSKG